MNTSTAAAAVPAPSTARDADLRAAMTGDILVVDDIEANRRLLTDLLSADGHRVRSAAGGEQALAMAHEQPPDLVLLDVLMPEMDGFTVCRLLRADETLATVAVVMVTTLDAKQDRIRGLEAGADDFLSKPIMRAELQARVRSLLRVKALYNEVERQRSELARWSVELEARVEEKLREIERLSELKRFFSPRLAERLVAEDRIDLLTSHRREVTVLFADLRGFTAFAEHASADVVMGALREFHTAMGELIFRYGGTLERFTGDGMMVFFNDPDPEPDHAERAVALACAMRDRAEDLGRGWSRIAGPTGLGLGLSLGPATIGAIGFEARIDYAAIGSVTNLAARLCSEASSGEVLVCESLWQAIGHKLRGSGAGVHDFKGFSRPTAAFRVEGHSFSAPPPA